MHYDPQNTFAKILRGELPCIPVYETTKPWLSWTSCHVLIIPKESAARIYDLSEASTVACIRTTRRAAIAVKEALHTDQFVIAQANGSLAGQTVHHVHFHIIPRFEGVVLKEHARIREEPETLEHFARLIIAAWPPD